VRAEILVVGSELLLGQIVDTNSAFIARELAGAGVDLYYKTTVGDNLARLEGAIRQAEPRSSSPPAASVPPWTISPERRWPPPPTVSWCSRPT